MFNNMNDGEQSAALNINHFLVNRLSRRSEKQRAATYAIETNPASALLKAFDLRLQCMRAVSAAKFSAGTTIHDPTQAQKVMDDIKALAKKKGISDLRALHAIEQLFCQQMTLAECVQAPYHDIWGKSYLTAVSHQQRLNNAYWQLRNIHRSHTLPIDVDEKNVDYTADDVLGLARKIIEYTNTQVFDVLLESGEDLFDAVMNEAFSDAFEKMLVVYMTPSASRASHQTIQQTVEELGRLKYPLLGRMPRTVLPVIAAYLPSEALLAFGKINKAYEEVVDLVLFSRHDPESIACHGSRISAQRARFCSNPMSHSSVFVEATKRSLTSPKSGIHHKLEALVFLAEQKQLIKPMPDSLMTHLSRGSNFHVLLRVATQDQKTRVFNEIISTIYSKQLDNQLIKSLSQVAPYVDYKQILKGIGLSAHVDLSSWSAGQALQALSILIPYTKTDDIRSTFRKAFFRFDADVWSGESILRVLSKLGPHVTQDDISEAIDHIITSVTRYPLSENSAAVHREALKTFSVLGPRATTEKCGTLFDRVIVPNLAYDQIENRSEACQALLAIVPCVDEAKLSDITNAVIRMLRNLDAAWVDSWVAPYGLKVLSAVAQRTKCTVDRAQIIDTALSKLEALPGSAGLNREIFPAACDLLIENAASLSEPQMLILIETICSSLAIVNLAIGERFAALCALKALAAVKTYEMSVIERVLFSLRHADESVQAAARKTFTAIVTHAKQEQLHEIVDMLQEGNSPLFPATICDVFPIIASRMEDKTKIRAMIDKSLSRIDENAYQYLQAEALQMLSKLVMCLDDKAYIDGLINKTRVMFQEYQERHTRRLTPHVILQVRVSLVLHTKDEVQIHRFISDGLSYLGNLSDSYTVNHATQKGILNGFSSVVPYVVDEAQIAAIIDIFLEKSEWHVAGLDVCSQLAHRVQQEKAVLIIQRIVRPSLENTASFIRREALHTFLEIAIHHESMIDDFIDIVISKYLCESSSPEDYTHGLDMLSQLMVKSAYGYQRLAAQRATPIAGMPGETWSVLFDLYTETHDLSKQNDADYSQDEASSLKNAAI